MTNIIDAKAVDAAWNNLKSKLLRPCAQRKSKSGGTHGSAGFFAASETRSRLVLRAYQPIRFSPAVCAVIDPDVHTYVDIDIAGGAADGVSICDMDKRYKTKTPARTKTGSAAW